MADVVAHETIMRGLRKISPGVRVISEESRRWTKTRPNAYWLIDPIDGTASWLGGFDGFVTQAAFIQAGVPVVGVIHAPLLGKTWTAKKGEGS